ncbi:MAG TPA: TadE/TadG family type IV pilus assembly protein [Xanthobacteraceae bacterium]|nr:TadE/TadG family type IV pilus assembly protein [Xanthobacteraceae bacterium]
MSRPSSCLLHGVALARGLYARSRTTSRAFRADRGGNVTLIFALAIIPIFGAVAAAVDYSRGNSARTAMQASLDATSLMISKEALDLQSGQIQQKAKSYFNSQFTRSDVKNLNLSFTLVTNGPGDFTVVGEATARIDTALAQVIGYKTMDLRVTSQVRWGFKSLELALALDNTGSMASKNKMVELKAAVKLLLATLKKNSRVPGDTKIAIVPFSTVVNVGTENADAPWIAYDSNITKGNWGGCVADRDQPNDVKDTAPSGGGSLFPVADCGGLAKSLPLTTNWSALESMVDTMKPAGMTNVTIGMMWGWHALSPTEPFSQGQVDRPDVDKVMILLTDGLNTANRFTTNASQIDSRTAAVCDNIKQAKIKLFTVRVIEGNLSLLQGCASASNMFYDVQVASQLTSVFASIAASLSGARLSK